MTRHLLTWAATAALTFAGGTSLAQAMTPMITGLHGGGATTPAQLSAGQNDAVLLAQLQQPSEGPAPSPSIVELNAPNAAPRPAPSAAGQAAQAPTAAPYLWSATRDAEGAVVSTGNVPARATQQYFAVRFPDSSEDRTTVRPDAPAGFAQSVLSALDILALLSEGEVAFDGTKWTVTGTPATAAAREEIVALIGSETPDWAVQLTPAAVAERAPPPAAEVPAPPEDSPSEPAAAASVVPADDPAALARCRDGVAELTAHNAILFRSGAAVIAESAQSELDAFASVLASCPAAMVYVEGHTDSDGDATKNLALSVARAEAVVNALVQRGIAAERLYAIGYGESQPIADNKTADGKRQNRRIIVTVDNQRP